TIYRISQLLPPPSLRLFSAPAAATPVLYTPSLHDALPICTTEHTQAPVAFEGDRADGGHGVLTSVFGLALLQSSTALRLQDDRRSEEHTSELQSRFDLVCRLLLEKKKEIAAVSVIAHRLAS